jgi:hypothetical protein
MRSSKDLFGVIEGHSYLDIIDSVCFHLIIRDRLDAWHLNLTSKSLGDELLRTNYHTF